jgi:subtilisin family serine protease
MNKKNFVKLFGLFLVMVVIQFSAASFGTNSLAQPPTSGNKEFPPQGPHPQKAKPVKGKHLTPRIAPRGPQFIEGEVIVILNDSAFRPNIPVIPESGVVNPGGGLVDPGGGVMESDPTSSGQGSNRLGSALARRRNVLKNVGDRLKIKHGVTVVRTSLTRGSLRLKLPQTLSIEGVINDIKNQKYPEVKFVEPNFRLFLDGQPDDLYWVGGKLWGMEKIEMRKVWEENIATGNDQIIVAVLDTGIDYNHPDLQGNMWRNPGEKRNNTPDVNDDRNNVDDDGNFIVDDIVGADFCNRAPAPVGHPTGEDVATGDPMDLDGHGTMVAGTIGAIGKNIIGVVGVNWIVRFMSLKILCDPPHNSQQGSWDAADAIGYAMSKHAVIINNSYHIQTGGWNSEDFHLAVQNANCENLPTDIPLPQFQYETCQPALMVASAGNTYQDNDVPINTVYPANFNVDNVIAVGATDATDTLWVEPCDPATCVGCDPMSCRVESLGSNWGPTTVDIAASGGNFYFQVEEGSSELGKVGIWSTYPISLAGSGGFPDDPYGIQVGTSMAAPHVAGCAALLQGKRKELSLPLLSPSHLKSILMESGDQRPGLLKSDGTGWIVGGRRLNCHKALLQLPVCSGGCADTMHPASPTNLNVIP